MKTFKELGLSREFVDMLEKSNIITPSEIQEKTIPLVLAGRDVVGGSATGSGKTLAFASGIVENLKKSERIQALILTPTRELAEQVANAISKFSRHKKLKVLPIYGGVDITNQMRRLRDADVVVGTPGRILDHLNRRTLRLDFIKFLVLDEVDRMFDMGFQKDVELILRECPEERQTMLFSATISLDDILVKKHTKKPAEVSIESHVDPSKLKQVFYDVSDSLKFSLFIHLMKKEKAGLVMVFCGTRRNVDFVANNLNNLGIHAKAIHGGLNQNQRNRVLKEFNSKEGVNVLVCTDVAARGLDIQAVSHVYNYDLPKTSDDYIHRIGRTARAGKEGIAINILCSRDYENFSNIQRDDKLKIEEEILPRFERVRIIVDSRDKRGGYGASRGRDFSRGRPQRDSRGGRSHSRDRSSSSRGPSRGRSSGRDGPRRDSRRDSRGGRSQGRSRPSREDEGEKSYSPRPGSRRVHTKGNVKRSNYSGRGRSSGQKRGRR